MKNFAGNKRINAWLAAFLVTAVLFLSGLFIITHAEHICTGEDCPVCAEIEACVSAIRLLSEAVGGSWYGSRCCPCLSCYIQIHIILSDRSSSLPGFFSQLKNPLR